MGRFVHSAADWSASRLTGVNGKTDSTVDSDPVIFRNHWNRVRDRKHRFPLFSSVLELVTAGSDTLARTLNLRHKLRIRGTEFESAVTVFDALLTLRSQTQSSRS
jgi:hypothetical protein